MIEQLLKEAKEACRRFQLVDKQTKIDALHAISAALMSNREMILQANRKDIEQARTNGMAEAMIDRLLLTEERIRDMADGVDMIAELPDPIGEVIRDIHRDNGLHIQQVRIPIGTVATIYESRPNVTTDIAAICIKTNNVCILKGGKEAFYSNGCLADVMCEAIRDILPVNPIYMVREMDRAVVTEIMNDTQHVDVIVPRGGKGLIQHVLNHSKVPVIETGAGICHLYIDAQADMKKALDIAVNAKIQRPSVCNAIETLLVHREIADEFLTRLKPLYAQVKIYGDDQTLKILDGEPATERNYKTEYDDLMINIKVVKDVEEAMEHIYRYSTKHSESIITENKETAQRFMDGLDSACVYHNASTRFTDGGQFGFGAEVGISTQKLHARGPIGLPEMTSTTYKIYGDGQIRE
ncbi:MAG: glutamate-5-semialdehyde dehydrogenase [Erysipelotrichaceae bacterium]|nr:glutamate-5-semialdehyde dehydrogenase [Erysipelotrichaceae bacterium]